MARKNQPGCPSGCGKTTVCVGACGGLPVFGVVVTAYRADGSAAASCTTGASGCCTLDVRAGRYTVTVAINGQVVYSAARTLGGGTTSIALGSGAGLVCCGGYLIPRVLTLTDVEGSLPFVFAPNYGFPLWTGGHSIQRLSSSVTTPSNACLVAAPSDGPVRVCYQMICRAGQDPTFSIQRSWSWVYRQGTLTPIWYQDPSGFAPGQLCITAPPPICGNPLTDTASFAADPRSTSPFVLSGAPAAAVTNATDDPVGGSITISA